MGILGSGDARDAIRGDYVTEDRLETIASAIGDEPVRFLARGSTLDVAGDAPDVVAKAGSGARRRGHVWIAATDEAVHVVPQWGDDTGVRLPYDNLVGADLDVAASPPGLRFATDDTAYELEAELPGRDELVAMAGFVRGKALVANRDGPNPVATVGRLTVLRERGLLDDAAYLEKRDRLLEEL